MDIEESVDVVYLDFQKAFDKVRHMRLLNEMRARGIRRKILAWIEGWLNGRRQRVGIKEAFSG